MNVADSIADELAETVLKRPGSVVIWTNCRHPYYDRNPFPHLNGDAKRACVGEWWPLFYAGHTIALANLKAILFVVDEAYADFGGQTLIPRVRETPGCACLLMRARSSTDWSRAACSSRTLPSRAPWIVACASRWARRWRTPAAYGALRTAVGEACDLKLQTEARCERKRP